MSITIPTLIETYALAYSCPQCFVARGQWCETITDKVAGELHESRWEPLQAYGQECYALGFEMGEAGADPVHEVADDDDPEEEV